MPNDKMRWATMSFENNIEDENKCKVCKNTCGGAHKCIKCNFYVHLICGKPTGDEGYGQSVLCNICETSRGT